MTTPPAPTPIEPTFKSSIDLDVNQVGVLTDKMKLDVAALVSALSDPNKIDRAVITRAIEKMINDLPKEFKAEIKDMEAFKRDISDGILRFAERVKGREATEDDTSMFVMDMMAIFMKHQAFSLIDNRVLDAGVLAKNYQPEIERRHISLGMQRLITIVTFAAATVTSWMTLTEWTGDALTYAKNASGVALSPNTMLALRQFIPVPVAIAFSQVVMKFKGVLEKRAQDDDINLARATGRTISHGFRSPRSSALTVAASLILLFDVGTNVTGLMTWALGRRSNQKQLSEIQLIIDDRAACVRKKLGEIGKVPQQFGRQADEVVSAELGGIGPDGKPLTSETGKGGAGPMFHAKRSVYMENADSKQWLLDHRSATAPSKKGKPAVAPTGDSLSKKLLAALDSSKLLDGVSFEEEVKAIIVAETKKVEMRLALIESSKKALDFTQATEMIQADVDAIFDQLDKVIKLINTDLSGGVGNRVEQYEKVNKAMLAIAQGAKEYKGTFDPSKSKSWKVPTLTMSTDRPKVDPMKFIGFKEIGDVMMEHWNAQERVFFALLFAFMAIASSYGDLVTLPWTRKGYGKDRKDAQKVQGEWAKQFKDKIITMLCLVINKGPFAHYVAPGGVVVPATIEAILNERIGELVTTPPVQEPKALTGFQKVTGGLRTVFTKPTDVAVDHNKQVHALREILTNPDEAALLLERILPGLALLMKPQAGDNPQNILQKNKAVVVQRNLDIQEKGLMGVRAKLEEIRAAGKADLSMAEWNTLWDAMDQPAADLRTLESTLLPAHRVLFDEIREEGNETVTLYTGLLAKIVDRETMKMLNELNDSVTNEELDAKEKLVVKLESHIPTSPSGVRTTAATLETDSALRGIENVLQKIEQIRGKRIDNAAAQIRLTRMADKLAAAEGHIDHLQEWMAMRNAPTPQNDKRLANAFIKLVFGKDHLIIPLSPGEKISPEDVAFIRQRHEEIQRAFDFLVDNSPDKNDEIDILRAQLAEGMNLIQSYL